MSIRIDEDLCIGCGACCDACTFGALQMNGGEHPDYNLTKCTSCSMCVDVCPMDAVTTVLQAAEHNEFDEYRGVWVFAEQRYGELELVSKELLGEGKKLARSLDTDLTMILLGHEKLNEMAKELIAYGTDHVLAIDSPLLDTYTTDGYANVIYQEIQKRKPEILLIGATMIGRDLGPRLAARLNTGLTADCTHLGIDAENRNLLQTRPAFGGNLMATIACPSARPQMATVRPGVMNMPEFNKDNKGTIEFVLSDLQPSDIRTTVQSVVSTIREELPIEDAKIVVAVGRGVKSSKDLVMIENLAKLLKASVAVTRPLAEAGWYPSSRQVGLTGKTIHPNLYLAIGISGSSQHIVGMQDSHCIVAINTDEDAPIFNVAHYGIVGDLYQIVPQMIQSFEQHYDILASFEHE